LEDLIGEHILSKERKIMRKKLLSLALTLVICLGLTVPALAVIVSKTPSADNMTISSVVSQEEVFYADPYVDEPETMTMYTVDPGTLISAPGEINMYPCVYENGTATKVSPDAAASCYESNVTVTAEEGGYWYVYSSFYNESIGNRFEACLLHVTGNAPVLNFTDVTSDMYFADSVKWAAYMKITEGTGNGMFSPNQTCTNAQILTFIWRAEGRPEPTISNLFTNSIPDAYAKAAVWAYEKGMVSGTTFDADKPCARAMAVTYLWQVAGSPDYSEYNSLNFSDVDASSSCAKAVIWAVGWITNGTSDTTFSPEEICTRGQIVTFLDRYKNSQ